MKPDKIHNCVFEAKNLSIGYPPNFAIFNINLQLKSGRLVALLGPNGSGKSTLIRTLAQLIPAVSGELYFNQLLVSKNSSSNWAKLIAVVLTSTVLSNNLSVFDVVASGRFPHTNWLGKLGTDDLAIIQKSLQQVGIDNLTNRYFHHLSDGEKQRVMIAKALAQQTPIIILDEPTAHLDLINRVEIMHLLQDLAHQEHKMILISTHELDLAIQMADRFWLVDEGKILDGAPEDLILSDNLQRVFSKLSLHFDPQMGAFRIRRSLTHQIHFVPQIGNQFHFWTLNGLNKLGFDITEKPSDLTLLFDDSTAKWLLAGKFGEQQFDNLAELSDFLLSNLV